MEETSVRGETFEDHIFEREVLLRSRVMETGRGVTGVLGRHAGLRAASTASMRRSNVVVIPSTCKRCCRQGKKVELGALTNFPGSNSIHQEVLCRRCRLTHTVPVNQCKFSLRRRRNASLSRTSGKLGVENALVCDRGIPLLGIRQFRQFVLGITLALTPSTPLLTTTPITQGG